MGNDVDVQIRSILEMADRLLTLSDEGFQSSSDDGCVLLNGMVRECAYRLRAAAERESQAHLSSGEHDDEHAPRA